MPPAQITLAWLLHKPGVTAPIVGATKVEHLDDAVATLDVTLTNMELHRPKSAAEGPAQSQWTTCTTSPTCRVL
ncbi:MAG: aldo/keto reductase [Pseudonocardiales bacterium]|nr:aldo/keto reductase [Pseudonocardiales bacterium]